MTVLQPSDTAAPMPAGGATRLRQPGMGATILVGAISTAFGVVLLSVAAYVTAFVRARPGLADVGAVALTLVVATAVLVGLSICIGALVTANTFATVVAGRTRQIARMRLLGASARRERTLIARQGLALGTIGATAGLVVGLVGAAAGLHLVSAVWRLDVDWPVLRPDLICPVVAVIAVTWAAAWIGARRVTTVTPLQAVAQSTEPRRDEITARRGRHAVAVALAIVGAGLLASGVVVGGTSAFGILIAFVGGAVSFSGIALGATLFLPPVLRAVGMLFGRGAVARMASANALRHSERSSRMAIGVVMGVALVTMFAVAAQSATRFVLEVLGEDLPAEASTAVDAVTGVMMGLVGVSAVIAAVGVVNLLVLGIMQRERELGLLRALGLSTTQVRSMVVLETAHIVVTSVVTGLALGSLYGWAGAQALLGWMPHQAGLADGPVLVPFALPLPMVVGIVIVTAVLTLSAAILPARLATRISPARSLAIEM